jgi:OPA family sugar phosphate sensor protein UhpC-like MFS transporter
MTFFRPAPALPPQHPDNSSYARRLRWSVFLSSTIGYALYYVCRLSFNVVKKPLVSEGLFTETELGIIGSALFFTYAAGKLTNGFWADRVNIKRFLAAGLLVSAGINCVLGASSLFWVFVVLWGGNGWAQSMGAPACVVGLSRWFPDRNRGSYYGFWSASHNLGEALTYILTALVVSLAGWRWGFEAAGLTSLAGVLLVSFFMHDSPASRGLPPVLSAQEANKSVGSMQLEVLRNPCVWLLALASACMYVSRYAINSWGIFFLEHQKAYTAVEAGSTIAVSSVCGIVGTVFSGLISDRFFRGSRYLPALLAGAMNAGAIALFVLIPKGGV